MKKNWKLFIAIAAMIGIVAWAVSSILPRSVSGANLTFGVGSGTVTINNPSDAPVAVQLVGKGTRSFSVSSSLESVAGSSTRQGSGSSATQLFEYASPPGTSEFTVTRGNSVNFLSNTDTNLAATIQPLSEGETRTTLVIAAIAVLGGLYYFSRSTGHRWMKIFQSREVPVLVVAPAAETPVGDANRGRDGRMYSNYGNKD
jgi:hypothetical protein